MAFNRINYDDCAYDLKLNRSVGPGNYRLSSDFADSCNKCYPYNEPSTSNNHASLVRENNDYGFGNITEAESMLTNRVNHLEKCNKHGKNDYYNKMKLTHKPLCDKTLEAQDTRFTNPLDQYRGMSLTNFHFTPYLHVNPQCFIQTNFHREGNSTRQMVKDCYKYPNQDFWDKGKALPPPPAEVKKDGCKVCCS